MRVKVLFCALSGIGTGCLVGGTALIGRYDSAMTLVVGSALLAMACAAWLGLLMVRTYL